MTFTNHPSCRTMAIVFLTAACAVPVANAGRFFGRARCNVIESSRTDCSTTYESVCCGPQHGLRSGSFLSSRDSRCYPQQRAYYGTVYPYYLSPPQTFPPFITPHSHDVETDPRKPDRSGGGEPAAGGGGGAGAGGSGAGGGKPAAGGGGGAGAGGSGAGGGKPAAGGDPKKPQGPIVDDLFDPQRPGSPQKQPSAAEEPNEKQDQPKNGKILDDVFGRINSKYGTEQYQTPQSRIAQLVSVDTTLLQDAGLGIKHKLHVQTTHIREWTDNTGQYHVHAKLINFDTKDSMVTLLKSGGTTCRVRISRLSMNDRVYVQQTVMSK